MLKLIKYFFYLVILIGIIFVVFAYAGPIFGINFTADIRWIELPFVLNIK